MSLQYSSRESGFCGGKSSWNLKHIFVYRVSLTKLACFVTAVFAGDIRFWMNKTRLGSEIDALTGLHNMRGFVVVADRIFAHAARDDSPASMLAIDVGDLAQVNETHGIGAGNGVLRSLAKRIKTSLRSNDGLARYGENSFVALLPGTPTGGALIAALTNSRGRYRMGVTA